MSFLIFQAILNNEFENLGIKLRICLNTRIRQKIMCFEILFIQITHRFIFCFAYQTNQIQSDYQLNVNFPRFIAERYIIIKSPEKYIPRTVSVKLSIRLTNCSCPFKRTLPQFIHIICR